jgi:hypothetical protein
MKATPRELGRAAFDAGKGLDQNPFEVESDDAFDWIDGWSEGEAEQADGE